MRSLMPRMYLFRKIRYVLKMRSVKSDLISGDSGISVVIPTHFGIGKSWNANSPIIEKCIRSIIDANPTHGLELVIVSSNLQSHNFFGLLDSKFSKRVKMEFLDESNHEFNFSRNINIGIKASSYSNLIVLNDDVLFLELNSIAQIHSRLISHPECIYGFLLLFPDLSVQHAGVSVTSSSLTHFFHKVNVKELEQIHGFIGNPYQVSAATGAVMAMNKEVWECVGGFDESFPLNFNDIDFCLRSRINGYEIWQDNSIAFMHYESATRSIGAKKDEIDLFFARYDPLPKLDPYLNRLLERNSSLIALL